MELAPKSAPFKERGHSESGPHQTVAADRLGDQSFSEAWN
jgi:hypothetical protein